MKRYIYILMISLALVSCEDDLNLSPISQAGSIGFYNNFDDFQQAVNGIYAAFGVSSNIDYPSLYVVLNECRSDNIYSPGQSGVRDWNAINNFENSIATLGTINHVWNRSFNAIMRANTVLDRLAEKGDVLSAAQRTQFEAEARFLRAFLYFDLVKWFGPLPKIETFLTPTEALEVERSSVSEIYDLIISDLTFAADQLPDSYSAGSVGRATSHIAKGVLARVYITRSGPQLHPDGPCLNSGEYAQAISLLDEIINSNSFSMVDDYASIFAYDNENNPEIVWAFSFITGGVGAGGYFPTEYYDEGWARVNLPFAGGNPGDGSKKVSDELIDSYEDGDLRIEPTIQFEYVSDQGDTLLGRFYDKFMDLAKAGGDRFDWSIDYPVLRYTDVMMLKAECLLQTGGDQNFVDQVVNAVRSRAGLDPISGVTLDQLLEERRREFAGENLRWDDLVRTGRVVDVMNAWRAVEEADQMDPKIQQITSDYIIYPIPSNQLDIKAGLYSQNQGYN